MADPQDIQQMNKEYDVRDELLTKDEKRISMKTAKLKPLEDAKQKPRQSQRPADDDFFK